MTEKSDPVEVMARAMHDADFIEACRTEEHYKSDPFYEQCYTRYARSALAAAEAAGMVMVRREVLEAYQKREKFMRGISPHVAAMMDEYDTPISASLAQQEKP